MGLVPVSIALRRAASPSASTKACTAAFLSLIARSTDRYPILILEGSARFPSALESNPPGIRVWKGQTPCIGEKPLFCTAGECSWS